MCLTKLAEHHFYIHLFLFLCIPLLLFSLVSKMRTKGVLVLLCVILTCGAQKWKQETSLRDPKGQDLCVVTLDVPVVC